MSKEDAENIVPQVKFKVLENIKKKELTKKRYEVKENPEDHLDSANALPSFSTVNARKRKRTVRWKMYLLW